MLRLFGPFEQAAHGVEKIARLRWRCGAAVAPGDDDPLRNRTVGLLPRRLDDLLEVTFTVAASRGSKVRPCRCLAIALDQPRQRARGRDQGWAHPPSDGGMILGAQNSGVP